MGINYGSHFNTLATSQDQPIPGSAQVPNSAGGYAFPVDDWVRLDRFLILGSEGGSYYATEQKLTKENAEAVLRCIKADGPRTVARIVEISEAGRAPKNDPALFALAMAMKLGDFDCRATALAAVPKVARIGTHLLHLAEYVQAFGGWGRGTRRAFASWYTGKPLDRLAYQLVKYQQRDGWSHRDILRLAHPSPKTHAASAERDATYKWVTKGVVPDMPSTTESDPGKGIAIIRAFEELKATTDPNLAASLIRTYGLPREAVPTELLASDVVWEALLEAPGLEMLIRNLATLTRVGLIAPISDWTVRISELITDSDALAKARVHPVKILAAMLTYQAGHGARGHHTWTPVAKIVDALDAAFYTAFKHVNSANKITLYALDISGSMTAGEVAGVPGLTPRVASAALALVCANTEPRRAFVGFTRGEISELKISTRQRLDDVCSYIDKLPFGGTDCALPMIWALNNNIPIDTFVILTDSETWAGGVHPPQALRSYREKIGIKAKLCTVGMVSNGFSIADPNDAGMLDVVGMDLSTPDLLVDFSRS